MLSRFFVMSIKIFTVSGPRVLPTSIFPSGLFSPSPTTVWRMEYDQAVSASSIQPSSKSSSEIIDLLMPIINTQKSFQLSVKAEVNIIMLCYCFFFLLIIPKNLHNL